jgi:hypothetical protein
MEGFDPAAFSSGGLRGQKLKGTWTMRLLRLCPIASMSAICISLALQPIWGAEANHLRFGVAKVDITPKNTTIQHWFSLEKEHKL